MAAELRELVNIGTGLVCLLVLLLGIRWQARTFRGDIATSQKRMASALVIALLCLVGAIGVCTYQVLDPRSGMTFEKLFSYIIGVSLFSVLFIAKTWVGPLIVATSASWAAYTFMQYGEMQLLPIFEMVMKFASEYVPKEFGVLYVVVTLTHSVAGSLYASWRHLGDLQ